MSWLSGDTGSKEWWDAAKKWADALPTLPPEQTVIAAGPSRPDCENITHQLSLKEKVEELNQQLDSRILELNNYLDTAAKKLQDARRENFELKTKNSDLEVRLTNQQKLLDGKDKELSDEISKRDEELKAENSRLELENGDLRRQLDVMREMLMSAMKGRVENQNNDHIELLDLQRKKAQRSMKTGKREVGGGKTAIKCTSRANIAEKVNQEMFSAQESSDNTSTQQQCCVHSDPDDPIGNTPDVTVDASPEKDNDEKSVHIGNDNCTQAMEAQNPAPLSEFEIFLRNLDPECTEADLQAHFLSCGSASRINIILDKITGKPLGHALIAFPDHLEGRRALDLNGSNLHGRKIMLTFKQPNGAEYEVFIQNLDRTCSEADLAAHFACCGHATRITILLDRRTRKPLGTALMAFIDQEAGLNALHMNGTTLHNTRIAASPKQPSKRGANPAHGPHAPWGTHAYDGPLMPPIPLISAYPKGIPQNANYAMQWMTDGVHAGDFIDSGSSSARRNVHPGHPGNMSRSISSSSINSIGLEGSDDAKSIFVRNVHPQCTEENLAKHFYACGTVVRVTIVEDRDTGRSKGMGYLHFSTQEEQGIALLMNGSFLHGKQLTVVKKRTNVPMMKKSAPRESMAGRADAPSRERGQRNVSFA